MYVIIRLKDGAIDVTFSKVDKRDLSAGSISKNNIL